MQSPDEHQICCPGPSLWKLITEHVPGPELSKIHTALGHFLVDMYTEAHTEAEMWYKMWQESQRGGNCGSRTGTPRTGQQGSSLADPPVVKELVRAEVKMLLQMLKERASKGGRDGEELVFRYKPDAVKYALGHLDSCYHNRISPAYTDHGSRPSSNCSIRSSAEDEVESLRDKVNVADIDQVVDRLKSVLMKECEVLSRLVQDMKKNIKQKCRSQCEFDHSEPTLAELRELRGAVQMDLELYSSTFAASPPASPSLPVRGLKNRFRLSEGQKASHETLQSFHSTSVPRPHPPPPLCHPKPRPPDGAPRTKTSTSVKPIHTSSLSECHGQYGSTLGSAESSKTISCKLSPSKHVSSLSPEQDTAGFHTRAQTSSPNFQIKPKRNSSIHGVHPSSRHSLYSDCSESNLSPQRERKCAAIRRSRISGTPPSSIPTLAPQSNTDNSESITEKSETLNGQKRSTSESSIVSSTIQEEKDKRKSLESSVMSEIGSLPAKTDHMKKNSQIHRYKNARPGKYMAEQQKSLSSYRLTDITRIHSKSDGLQGQARFTRPADAQLNGLFRTSPKMSLEGSTGQPRSVQNAQTEPEFMKVYQPVPPSRVLT